MVNGTLVTPFPMTAAERAVEYFAEDAESANHAKALANLGDVLSEVDDVLAEELLRTALGLERTLGIVDFEVHTGALLGRLLKRTGRVAEGKVLLAQVAERSEQVWGERADALRGELDD
jgi:hypothetical protein